MAVGKVFAQNIDDESRASFMATQDAYLQSLNLDFYQNKEYQIITRNTDKQERNITLSTMPERMKKKKIKRLRKEKNKQMRELLDKRQYQLYINRQKVIEKTLANQVSF